jgi:DNA-binding beta-propeller fold protein YncE
MRRRRTLVSAVLAGLVALATGCSVPVTRPLRHIQRLDLSFVPTRFAFGTTGFFIAGEGWVEAFDRQLVSTFRTKIEIFPAAMVPSADGQYVFVAGATIEKDWSGRLLKIETSSGRIEGTLDLGERVVPIDAGMAPMDAFLYLCNTNHPSLIVVDPRSFTIVNRIPLREGGCFGLAALQDGVTVALVHASTRSLSILNVRTERSQVIRGIGEIPVALALTPDDRYAYVMDNGDAAVLVVSLKGDDAERVQRIATSRFAPAFGTGRSFNPSATVRYTSARNEIFAWGIYLDHAVVIDAASKKVKYMLPLSGKTYRASSDPTGGMVVQSIEDDSSVRVYRTPTD